MYDEYTSLFTDFLSHTVPEYFYCLSDSEKNQYIYDVLLNPTNPCSFVFSAFFSVIQRDEASSTLLLLFYKFLSSRIIPLLVDMTSLTGNELILQREFNDSNMRNLLHLCDVINNKYPHIQSSFFNPSVYFPWLADSVIRLFLVHSDSCDTTTLHSLFTKSCILGFSKPLATSYYRYLQLYERKWRASNSDERLFLLQPKSHSMQLFLSFFHSLPSLRLTDFVTQVLHSFFTQPNQVSFWFSIHL